jgi:hypothetical protein
MDSFRERKTILQYLRDNFNYNSKDWYSAKNLARIQNPWFTEASMETALKSIFTYILDDSTLQAIEQTYSSDLNPPRKHQVGLILAGNIPFVGWHDILSVFLSGHIAIVKTSSKDTTLINYLVSKMIEIDPRVAERIQFRDRLNGADAYIATGSDNSVRYFEHYIGKYPSIIRKNRNSIAILDGKETEKDLLSLGEDVFSFFGLGCRNVSKVYFPKGYDFKPLMGIWHDAYKEIVLHNHYKNNFDYCYTMYLLNKMEFYMNGCILITPDHRLSSRISMLHYEHYDSIADLRQNIEDLKDQIQCIVACESIRIEIPHAIPFGTAQHPGFFDFADGVDTMQFLTSLSSLKSVATI